MFNLKEGARARFAELAARAAVSVRRGKAEPARLPSPSGAGDQAGDADSSVLLDRALLTLVAWPNLARMPRQDVPELSRICALLSWKPTVGFLVPRTLGLPQQRVQQLLGQLHAAGFLGAGASASAGLPGLEPETAQLPVPDPGEATARAFIGRLWQRLTSR